MRSLLILLLILSSVVILIGAFAKFQQWPFANMLLAAGFLTEIACAVLLVVYFLKQRREE